MRYVYSHREEARKVGQKARKDIVEKYSQEKVAEIVLSHLERISKKLQLTF